jgi:hypothetical protein
MPRATYGSSAPRARCGRFKSAEGDRIRPFCTFCWAALGVAHAFDARRTARRLRPRGGGSNPIPLRRHHPAISAARSTGALASDTEADPRVTIASGEQDHVCAAFACVRGGIRVTCYSWIAR